MLNSLRTRLVIGVVGAASVFLCIAAIALYTAVANALTNEFDAVLGSKARILSIMVVEGDDWYKLVYERIHFPEYESGSESEYFEIWRPNGSTLQRSPSLGREDLPRLGGALARPNTAGWILPDGRIGRVAGISFIPRREDGSQPELTDDRVMTLTVAQSTVDLERRLRRFRWLLVAIFAGASVAAGIALAVVVSGFMRPLRHLARRLAMLDADDLSARFADVRWVEELRPIADRLDDLFLRLDQAFRREKAFTSDVAHELRTPLAGLRATVDVTLRTPRDSADYRNALASCHDQIERLQSIVDTLLSLAQLEGGRLQVVREPLVLASIIHDAWQPYARETAERQVTVKQQCDVEVIAEADTTQLRIIVANLFDNAVSYVNVGGQIIIQLRRNGQYAAVVIENTGYEGSSDDAERLFDRFARGDRARTAGRHCGLGLALSRRLAGLLGGTLQASTRDQRFCIELRVPLAQQPAPDDIA